MVTAKVLENTGEEIKLGFDDGSFRTVAAKDIGFAAPVGSKIDVYENHDGEDSGYAYAQHKSSSGNINLDIQSTQDGKTLVNKIAYCVLAFFVGGFGAHKFYAHKYVKGVSSEKISSIRRNNLNDFRIAFSFDESRRQIELLQIYSGYSAEDLKAGEDIYGDKPIHRDFLAHFAQMPKA